MAKKNNNDIDGTIPDELGFFHHHFSITMELDKHPLLSGMAFVAVILISLFILRKGIGIKASNSSSGVNGVSAQSAIPYGVAPPTQTGPTSVTIGNPVSSPVPVVPVQQNTRTIRAKGTVLPYDNNNTGVPLRSSPGGSIVSTIPFGATVTVNGSSQTGPDNFGTVGTTGSSTWFPVLYNNVTGFVSAFDLV